MHKQANFTLKPNVLQESLMVAYAQLYDERGANVELDIKESKQGLGITRRNKKSYYGQQMVMLLGQLTYNVVGWIKRWLIGSALKLRKYGIKRMVRDVMTTSGFIEFSKHEAIERVVISGASALARQCAKALRALLETEHLQLILGETYGNIERVR